MNITATGTTAAANQPAATTEKTKPDALGQDAFLKILIAQLKYQDPMEPQKDAEFIGQMAQFSSLEQLTQLNKTMTGYAGEGGTASLAGSAHLLGTEISWSANGQSGTGAPIRSGGSHGSPRKWSTMSSGCVGLPAMPGHQIFLNDTHRAEPI